MVNLLTISHKVKIKNRAEIFWTFSCFKLYLRGTRSYTTRTKKRKKTWVNCSNLCQRRFHRFHRVLWPTNSNWVIIIIIIIIIILFISWRSRLAVDWNDASYTPYWIFSGRLFSQIYKKHVDFQGKLPSILLKPFSTREVLNH